MLGTRETLFSLNVLIQRCRDNNVSIDACFIGNQKLFDCVCHQKMIENLRKDYALSQNSIGTKLQQSKYQKASEDIWTRRGVRQVCVLSSLLFKLCTSIFREAFDEAQGGVIPTTVLIANNVQELQNVINSVVCHSEMFDLQLNVSKTNIIVCSQTLLNLHLHVKGQRIEQVTSI